ncbi:hypothetical protein MTO96_022027 [Rhipicephalus appendiculatus]
MASTNLGHRALGRRRNALLKVKELSLGQRTYPVSAYLAAPDDSCKGIVPGLEPGTPSHTLVEEMQATGIQILQARMMGQTNIALVTFEGLRVPRFVHFLGAELRCYPPPPPDRWSAKRASNWDTEPTIAPHRTSKLCPRRQRQPFNRSSVKKAIDEEQRQLTESTNAAPPSATTDNSVIPLKKSGRSRSKKRSTSHSKARTKSKSRSRSRSQSTSARIQEKRPTIPASQGIPIALQEGTLRQAGNFDSYNGPSATTGLEQQQVPRRHLGR